MHHQCVMERPAARSLADHVGLLLNYECRRLRYYEAIGDLQPNDLRPEDIVDQAYLEAGEQLRRGAAGEAGYRWLRSLADRVLDREVRRIRAERAKADESREPEAIVARRLPELWPDPTAPISEEVAQANEELQRALERILGELPDELREPFVLVVADGYSREDVAVFEALTPDEVTCRVALTIRLLRDRLAREYEGEPPPLEQTFRLVERMPPTPTATARARASLGEAVESAPPPAG